MLHHLKMLQPTAGILSMARPAIGPFHQRHHHNRPHQHNHHLRVIVSTRSYLFGNIYNCKRRLFHIFSTTRFGTSHHHQASRDPWTLLGLQRGASEDEIKKAWRKKAKELHPDLNPKDPTAKSRFQETKQAYETLTNSDLRAKYELERDFPSHPRYHSSASSTPRYGDNPYQQQQEMDQVWKDFERMFHEMHKQTAQRRQASDSGSDMGGYWREKVQRGPFGEFRTYTWTSEPPRTARQQQQNTTSSRSRSTNSTSADEKRARSRAKNAEKQEHDIFQEIFDSFWGIKKPHAQFDENRAYDFLPSRFQMKNVGTAEHTDFEISNETLSYGNVRQMEKDPTLMEHVLEDELIARAQLFNNRVAGGLTNQMISVTDAYGSILANISSTAPHSLLTNFVREIRVAAPAGDTLMTVSKTSILFNRFVFRDPSGITIATAGRSLASAGAPYQFVFSSLHENLHPSLFLLPIAFFNVEKKWSVVESLKQIWKSLFG